MWPAETRSVTGFRPPLAATHLGAAAEEGVEEDLVVGTDVTEALLTRSAGRSERLHPFNADRRVSLAGCVIDGVAPPTLAGWLPGLTDKRAQYGTAPFDVATISRRDHACADRRASGRVFCRQNCIRTVSTRGGHVNAVYTDRTNCTNLSFSYSLIFASLQTNIRCRSD